MFFCSLGSILIYGCTHFWRFLAIPFISSFLIFAFLFFLLCAPNRSVPCISYSSFIPSNLSIYYAFYLCFYSSTTPAILCHFSNCLSIFPISHVPSCPSLHFLLFPCNGGRSALFQSCCIFFLGYPF